MCGYLGNVTDDPLYRTLMDLVKAKNQLGLELNNPGTGPAASINIIHDAVGERLIDKAIWWLLLDKQPDGSLKPSKYTSFNTRSDKLNVPRSAGYKPFRESRCLIPATYIIEGEGAKNARKYHKIEPTNCGFALGGLYRTWLDESTGEELKSCSVVTLPPRPEWKDIHSKSTPLFLPANDSDVIDQWLDPSVKNVEVFDWLMEPEFRDELKATPIDRPGSQEVIGEVKSI